MNSDIFSVFYIQNIYNLKMKKNGFFQKSKKKFLYVNWLYGIMIFSIFNGE